MAVCIELLTRIVDAPTNPSVRLVQLAEANGLPSLRTGARRQDRALSGRELGILLPLHDTALIDMTSGRIIPLLSSRRSVVSSSDQSVCALFSGSLLSSHSIPIAILAFSRLSTPLAHRDKRGPERKFLRGRPIRRGLVSNPIQTRLVIERILPAIGPLFASQASTTMVLSSSSKGCPVRTRGLCRPYSPPLLWPPR